MRVNVVLSMKGRALNEQVKRALEISSESNSDKLPAIRGQ